MSVSRAGKNEKMDCCGNLNVCLVALTSGFGALIWCIKIELEKKKEN